MQSVEKHRVFFLAGVGAGQDAPSTDKITGGCESGAMSPGNRQNYWWVWERGRMPRLPVSGPTRMVCVARLPNMS